MEHLTLRGLCCAIPGGLLCWVSGIIWDGGLRGRAFLRGGPVGELGSVLVCRGLT
jgi:hypothetical protein